MLVYFNEDVQRIFGYGKSKAGKIIKDLNNELAEMGYYVNEGRVPKHYLHERFYLGAIDNELQETKEGESEQ